MTRSEDMASSTSWIACSPETSIGNIIRGYTATLKSGMMGITPGT